MTRYVIRSTMDGINQYVKVLVPMGNGEYAVRYTCSVIDAMFFTKEEVDRIPTTYGEHVSIQI